MFSLDVGRCQLCANQAEFGVGSITCEECGSTFSNLCHICGSRKECPRCGGVLNSTADVFPHNFFLAIKNGDGESVLRLIRKYTPNLNELIDSNGCTTLGLAARIKDKKNAFEMCELLIDNGGSVHMRGMAGRTPLIEMVHLRTWDRKIAAIFSESVNDQDNSGLTAIMFASRGHGLMAQRRGNLTIVKELVNLGANLSIAARNGLTALGYAMEANDTDNNNEVIDFLKFAMVKQEALSRFNTQYSYNFTENGELSVCER